MVKYVYKKLNIKKKIVQINIGNGVKKFKVWSKKEELFLYLYLIIVIFNEQDMNQFIVC